MKNLVQYDGKMVYAIAPTGGVVSGMGYIIGSMFGIAAIDAAAGETFALWVEGVWTLPKTAGVAWTPGLKIQWDTSAEEACTTGGDLIIGVATKAAGSSDTEGEVRLNGAFGLPQT